MEAQLETIEKRGSENAERRPVNPTPPMNEKDGKDAFSIDKEALLLAFDHDWHFLKETVDMLLEDYPPLLAAIKETIDNDDADGLRRAAHSLKGMVGNFQATAAAGAALELEHMCRQGNFSNARPVYDFLVNEMERFSRRLLKILKEEKP